MKNILFFDPNLNERGTSVATYDYALFNETILGNKSTIVSLKNGTLESFDKFNNRFNTKLVNNIQEIYQIPCDYYYTLKYGFNDNNIHPEAKNLVHTVFPAFDPHGDVYAYVSKWLAESHGNGYPYVPHMVNLPDIQDDYRTFFNIKDSNLVVGWYGGDNFEIPFAREAVTKVAAARKDIVFLFMNQTPFCDLTNVIFVNSTTDQEEKVAFINTCDVMIHARERGETFGLAIAEFSSKNKPVITYFSSPEKSHLEILGSKGLYYTDYNSLVAILENLTKKELQGKDWNCYQEYTPVRIMEKFNNVFLR